MDNRKDSGNGFRYLFGAGLLWLALMGYCTVTGMGDDKAQADDRNRTMIEEVSRDPEVR